MGLGKWAKGLFGDAAHILSANEAVQKQAGLYAKRIGSHLDELAKAADITEDVMRKYHLDPSDVKQAAADMMKAANVADPDQVGAYTKDAAMKMLRERQTRLSAMAENGGKFTEMSGALIEAGGIGSIGGIAKQYYLGGDLKQNAIRIGATYAGVSIVGRALSGGGITTKANGERDIVGIPFI
jgi:hypothetical protein